MHAHAWVLDLQAFGRSFFNRRWTFRALKNLIKQGESRSLFHAKYPASFSLAVSPIMTSAVASSACLESGLYLRINSYL